MTCAPQTRIADSPTIRYTGINRRLRRFLAREAPHLHRLIAQSAASCGAERYRKHFDSFAHFLLLLFHGLSASPSLRQTYAAFFSSPKLIALSGLGLEGERERGISFSQFAHSNSSRPYQFLLSLIPTLSQLVIALGPQSGLPKDLLILDSTFLPLSLALASWLPPAQKKSGEGVRVQLEYTPALDLPESFIITDARTNDCQGLDLALLGEPTELERVQGRTLVFDLGYYSHRRYETLINSGIHLVSRLSEQAHYQVEEELPHQGLLLRSPSERLEVLRDERITLGSPNNRAGAVIPNIRLVTAGVQRGKGPTLTYRIVTDRWDLNASEVVLLYVYRWQIELFFRWLKSHIKLDRLLGYSPNALYLSIILAIIIHLICLLAALRCGAGERSVCLLRQLSYLLADLEPDHPPPIPIQLTLPHWGSALC